MIRLLLLVHLVPAVATAQLRVAPIFSDNMVLQRDKPIRVWGTAVPGQEVVVAFGTEREVSVAEADSSWWVEFSRRPASKDPLSIVVRSGDEVMDLNNLLIGDLWLCIGQSNMEWPLSKEKHFQEGLAANDQRLLRLYNPTYAGKNIYGQRFHDTTMFRLNGHDFYEGEWEDANRHTIEDMSAVAYHFATKIIRHENIPIGVIHLAIGGAPIETFIDVGALRSDAYFSAKARGNWLTNEALPIWIRERGRQNVGDRDDVYTDDLGPNHAYKPGFAFEHGIKPITPLPLRGILWYQGESNAQEMDRVEEYGDLQKLMVDDYRKNWNDPTLPFYFVQLSSIDTLRYKGYLWPQFRDEQRKTLDKIKHSGMVVCSDIGDRNDVHPRNKKAVGERLALWALNKSYGHKDVIPSGPLPIRAAYGKGNVVITFQYAADGLTTNLGDGLKGFSIDGKHPADAKIVGNTVVIVTAKKPQHVYYAWAPYTDANLVNSEMLPASTFKLKVQ